MPRYITTIGVDYGVKKMNIKDRRVAVTASYNLTISESVIGELF